MNLMKDDTKRDGTSPVRFYLYICAMIFCVHPLQACSRYSKKLHAMWVYNAVGTVRSCMLCGCIIQMLCGCYTGVWFLVFELLPSYLEMELRNRLARLATSRLTQR